MSGPKPDNGIVVRLIRDHEVLRHHLTGFGELEHERWEQKFEELTASLVRHEVAEQRVIYPAVRTDLLSGSAVATALIAQESEAEELLATLVKLDSEGDSFAAVLDQFQSLVLDHMRDEETLLFPLLRDLEDDVRQSELAHRYAHAVTVAPTHPHPLAPDASPANAVVSPIAALVDRVRDAVHARSG
jgi:hemerythrin superfamily protein